MHIDRLTRSASDTMCTATVHSVELSPQQTPLITWLPAEFPLFCSLVKHYPDLVPDLNCCLCYKLV